MAKTNSSGLDVYSDVIAKITADSIEKVPNITLTAHGSKSSKSRHVQAYFLGEDTVNVDILVNVTIGSIVPEVVCAAQETIKTDIEKATKFKVGTVNVHVVSVVTETECLFGG